MTSLLSLLSLSTGVLMSHSSQPAARTALGLMRLLHVLLFRCSRAVHGRGVRAQPYNRTHPPTHPHPQLVPSARRDIHICNFNFGARIFHVLWEIYGHGGATREERHPTLLLFKARRWMHACKWDFQFFQWYSVGKGQRKHRKWEDSVFFFTESKALKIDVYRFFGGTCLIFWVRYAKNSSQILLCNLNIHEILVLELNVVVRSKFNMGFRF
jgi:hypothetical protein